MCILCLGKSSALRAGARQLLGTGGPCALSKASGGAATLEQATKAVGTRFFSSAMPEPAHDAPAPNELEGKVCA